MTLDALILAIEGILVTLSVVLPVLLVESYLEMGNELPIRRPKRSIHNRSLI